MSEKFDAIHYQMKAVLRSWVRDYGYPDVKNSSYRHPYEGRVCTLGMIVEKLTMLKPAELSLLLVANTVPLFASAVVVLVRLVPTKCPDGSLIGAVNPVL